MKKGFDVLRDKTLNRSIAFTRAERRRLGLTGLLPHRVSTSDELIDRVMTNLERLPRDIDRYMLLSSMQERNERLFYRIVIEHFEEGGKGLTRCRILSVRASRCIRREPIERIGSTL